MTTARTNQAGPQPVGCDCGTRVVWLDVEGVHTAVDADRDTEGDVFAMKVGGKWRYVAKANASGPGFWYRQHRCQPTRRAANAAVAAASLGRAATSGPCAGCGTRDHEKYGPNGRPLCPACSEALAAWRALPADRRGPLPPTTTGRARVDTPSDGA